MKSNNDQWTDNNHGIMRQSNIRRLMARNVGISARLNFILYDPFNTIVAHTRTRFTIWSETVDRFATLYHIGSITMCLLLEAAA